MAINRPIGLFDSGVGGLSVLLAIKKLLPNEKFIFIADQANVPYGAKTQKELQELSGKVASFLLLKNVSMIVVACNTATCYALDYLGEKIKNPIIGVVPALKPAAQKTKNDKIAIMSTPATAKSAYLKNLASKFARGKKTLLLGCKGLEDAIEILDEKAIKDLVAKYAKEIKSFGADIIVLGCTHYPFFKEQIQKGIGKNSKIIDSGRAVAKRVKQLLTESDGLSGHGKPVSDEFYTTGDPKKFSLVASKLLKYKITGKKAYI